MIFFSLSLCYNKTHNNPDAIETTNHKLIQAGDNDESNYTPK